MEIHVGNSIIASFIFVILFLSELVFLTIDLYEFLIGVINWINMHNFVECLIPLVEYSLEKMLTDIC